ncbi:MAG: hypothetical protein ABR568_16045 [Pyrinomonadaceae bacterium]
MIYHGLQIQLIGDAVAAIVLLVVATVLSVYKPADMTASGRRKQLKASKYQDVPALDDIPAVGKDRVDLNRTPRWVYVVGIHAIGLTILFLVFHLLGGGLPIQ